MLFSALGGRKWAFGPRSLIAGFVLAALFPCLVLGATWLNSTSKRTPLPKPQAETSAVLSVPDRIETTAGGHVKFPIALDGTDGVPSRSVIAIKGLPQDSNFSEGRPFGNSEWNLKPDQIGDLSLVLPATARGQFKLGILLIDPDDKVVAEAETLLEIRLASAPTGPVAVKESGIRLPEGTGPSLAAAVPVEGSEAPVLVPVPDAISRGIQPEETPTTIEATTAPSDATQSDQVTPPAEPATSLPGDAPDDKAEPAKSGESGFGTVQPSVFVNLREGPSSSAPVLGVIAKGAELSVLDRKRGWVQVTDPGGGKKGWIYSGLLAGEAKPYRRGMRVAPAESEPKSGSFWHRLGKWLTPWKGS